MIFPSTAGTWRDPDNFRARWRKVRDQLGVPEVTSHSFRKSLATLIDDEGLSARIGADQLVSCVISYFTLSDGRGRMVYGPFCCSAAFG